jgi:hypothetical protein
MKINDIKLEISEDVFNGYHNQDICSSHSCTIILSYKTSIIAATPARIHLPISGPDRSCREKT